MADYWLDSNSLIVPSDNYYRFDLVPRFWEILVELAQDGVIAIPEPVFDELKDYGDDLASWVIEHKAIIAVPQSAQVQSVHQQVLRNVVSNPRFTAPNVETFCAKADTWLIAYAKSLGGKIATFEKEEPASKKPKIPDVAKEFGVECVKIYDMLTELNVQL